VKYFKNFPEFFFTFFKVKYFVVHLNVSVFFRRMMFGVSLNRPHNELKLEQNSFKTVSKLFQICFKSVLFRFHFVARTVLRGGVLLAHRQL